MTNLQLLFHPRAVAVVGASATPGKIGYTLVDNIVRQGYRGEVYPVNPRAGEILGLPAYPSMQAIGRPVDLAVVAVPGPAVNPVAEECGAAGVRFLVVVSAGFKEVGAEGLARERELVNICRRHKMRLVGPNCVGVMDTTTPLNASFAAGFPRRGRIAFISQSGAMLLSILDWSMGGGPGFTQFVSLGNKADLAESDFIAGAAADPETRVILCYIEDVARGEEFLAVAREAAAVKPVIILKSGTSQAGARAASSHTGALAGSDVAYETAFRQSGVIRARSMAELFDLAAAFASQPVPAGRRVAIVTNAGGPGIITTDRVELAGLTMARLGRETSERLRQGLPEESSVYNPVDVLGDARADRFRFALQGVLADEGVDAALVLVCPAAVTEPEATARALLDLRRQYPAKPVLAAFMGGESLREGARLLEREGIPCFTFPEPAVEALRGLAAYGEARERLRRPAQLQDGEVDAGAVEEVFRRVRREGRLVLLGSEGAAVAAACGLPAAPTRLAVDAGQAVEIAESLGYPVVLKVASPKIVHKSDVGGVRVGLADAQAVRQGFLGILESVHRYLPDTPVHGVEVQPMQPGGTELIVGMTRDVQFGPLLAVGLGGIYVNLLNDVAFRLARGLSRAEVEEMLAETRAYTLLRGYRGEPPRDVGAVVDTVYRLARLSLAFPDIAEMEINPLLCFPQGASALDVKITLSGQEVKEK